MVSFVMATGCSGGSFSLVIPGRVYRCVGGTSPETEEVLSNNEGVDSTPPVRLCGDRGRRRGGLHESVCALAPSAWLALRRDPYCDRLDMIPQTYE